MIYGKRTRIQRNPHMNSTLSIITIYLIAVNILGFASMGIDKYRAINHGWRISEAMLFFFALIGGSLGSVLGMQLFRHKTRHWYFKYGMPLILVFQILLLVLLKLQPWFKIGIL